jgi:hypothetical protein
MFKHCVAAASVVVIYCLCEGNEVGLRTMCGGTRPT